jgi:hypothetical protein
VTGRPRPSEWKQWRTGLFSCSFIFISLQFYSWFMIRHESIISLYSYLLRIEKTSDPYLYSSNVRSKFVYGNIRIHICFRFENMKTDMGRTLYEYYVQKIHTVGSEI